MFMGGIPTDINQLLGAGSKMESLDLGHILAEARAVIRNNSVTTAPLVQWSHAKAPVNQVSGGNRGFSPVDDATSAMARITSPETA